MNSEENSAEVISVPIPKLDEVDRLALELAKQKRLLALSQAEKALVINEKAELEYKYVVLQLYLKYKLDSSDAISESGEILKGGAKSQSV